MKLSSLKNLFLSKLLKKLFCFYILGDPEKQGDLIKQLQEQHYIQYIQQLQAAQRESSDNKSDTNVNNKVSKLLR